MIPLGGAARKRPRLIVRQFTHKITQTISVHWIGEQSDIHRLTLSSLPGRLRCIRCLSAQLRISSPSDYNVRFDPMMLQLGKVIVRACRQSEKCKCRGRCMWETVPAEPDYYTMSLR